MRPVLALALLLVPAAALAAPPAVTVCWDYGCDARREVVLSASAWERIRGLFSPIPADAAGERRRIARAIALFERETGQRVGTSADLGGNVAGSGRPYQMDCIDESRNTDGYLRVLEKRGLLRWHDVMDRRRRAPWLLDQHWTAVVRARTDGTDWAVDSWYLDNGREPYIQRLAAWLEKAELPFNPDAPREES